MRRAILAGLVAFCCSYNASAEVLPDSTRLYELRLGSDVLVIQRPMVTGARGSGFGGGFTESGLQFLTAAREYRGHGCQLNVGWRYEDFGISAAESAAMQSQVSNLLIAGERWLLNSWTTGVGGIHFEAPARLTSFPVTQSSTLSTELLIDCGGTDVLLWTVGQLRRALNWGVYFYRP